MMKRQTALPDKAHFERKSLRGAVVIDQVFNSLSTDRNLQGNLEETRKNRTGMNTIKKPFLDSIMFSLRLLILGILMFFRNKNLFALFIVCI